MRRILVTGSLLVLGFTAAVQAQSKAAQLVITSAAGDPINDQIIINGANFGAVASQVSLQGITLPIHSWSDNQIIALYGVSTAPAGTYLLIVSKGPSSSHSDAFHLTLGAVGPKGEQGEPGVKGDPGVQGEKGEKGETGAAGATGATGAQGPAGPQGLAGNLALAGNACDSGKFVTGFDAAGHLVCAAPPEPVTLRTTVMVCGATNRSVTSFVPAGVPLHVVTGCAPDGTTQALLITRSGSYNAAAVQAYVDGGGIVITEYSKAAGVYNAVFGGPVATGLRFGACADTVNPVVQFNAADPFWTSTPPFSATPLSQSGCGFDISAYPGLTALGGWSETTVSLAYRARGAGRVWFVEADWADSSAADYTASNTLMGYMITHR